MRTTKFLLATLKETPADAEVVSHQLMLRAGMIRKLTSGNYTWLPMGLRVLHKVINIVREEMNKSGALEILMPSVQPAELWHETGRYEQYGAELLRFKDRNDREFCYGPTHEEVITDLARRELHSYKQLPLNLYQIQTKFRDEIRPRFGVMRGREFLMKDAYSFHATAESLDETYQVMFDTYCNIFSRMGLDFRPVQADSGSIGGDKSHEFQVLAQTGEDVLAISTESDFAANIELLEKDGIKDPKDGDPSPDGKGTLKMIRGIEVGHIFQLGTKYSHAMKADVLDPEGKKVDVTMGCYGIGVSRIVAAAIEQNHDENGIIWPDALAPFELAIIPINLHKSPRVQEASDKVYQELQAKGIDVLLDDRKERPGFKFRDMDLIGIPHRLILSERGLDEGTIEYKHRKDEEATVVKLEELAEFLTKRIDLKA